MKIKLEIRKNRGEILNWKDCEPFVENNKALLIHRPRSVQLFRISDKYPSHLAIKAYCGATFCGNKKFTFLSMLNNNHIVCDVCEKKAIEKGLNSSFEICGKHIHTGGVKSYIKCCGGGHE